MAILKFERHNYKIEDMRFPDYLVDMTSETDYFVEIKQDLQSVFTEFFLSESFKTSDDTGGIRMLHYSLNQLLDDLHLAHNEGKINYMKEQLEKVRALDRVEPKKEILN